MVARVVETVCMRAGYMTFVYNTDEDSEHEDDPPMMRMQRVAGMILISTRSDAAHGRWLMGASGVPTVLFGPAVEGTPSTSSSLDDAERAGSPRPSSLGFSATGGSRSSPAGRRAGRAHQDRPGIGARDARGHGIEPTREDLILPAEFMQERAFELSRALLTRPDPPTATSRSAT